MPLPGLTGPQPNAEVQADATITFRGVDVKETSTTSWPHAFPAVTIDSADTEILVILCTTNDRTLSSATIAGNNSGSHTAAVLSTVTSGYEFILLHATGFSGDTTATLSVTFNNPLNGGFCFGMWAVTDISTTPSSSSSIDFSTPYGSSGDIPTGGVGVALLALTTPAADAYTINPAWSNWTGAGAETNTADASFDYHVAAGEYEGALTANPSLTLTGVGTVTASRYCAFTLSPG